MNRFDFSMTRRDALAAVASSAVVAAGTSFAIAAPTAEKFKSKRPPVGQRKFVSEAVEKALTTVRSKIADPELAWMFENCYPNTLDTTVEYEEIDGKPDSFIITGDIDAMWLARFDGPGLAVFALSGAGREAPQAGGGPRSPAGPVHFARSVTRTPSTRIRVAPRNGRATSPSPIPGVHERKWEIDSLCYPVRLANAYLEHTGDTSTL